MPAPAHPPAARKRGKRTPEEEAPTTPPPSHRVTEIQKASLRAPRLPVALVEEFLADRRKDPRAE